MKKSQIIVILTILVLMLGLFLFWQKSIKTTQPETKVLPSVNRNLNQDQIKFYEDRIVKAEEFLKNLSKTDINFKQHQIHNYIYIAQQYFGLGELQKSKEAYDFVLTLSANQEQALVGLATIYNEIKDSASERSVLERAVEATPKNTDIWLRYITVNKNSGATIDQISELYIQALEKTERHVDIIVSYATFLGELGKKVEAIKLWQEAKKKYPSNSVMYQAEIDKLK